MPQRVYTFTSEMQFNQSDYLMWIFIPMAGKDCAISAKNNGLCSDYGQTKIRTMRGFSMAKDLCRYPFTSELSMMVVCTADCELSNPYLKFRVVCRNSVYPSELRYQVVIRNSTSIVLMFDTIMSGNDSGLWVYAVFVVLILFAC